MITSDILVQDVPASLFACEDRELSNGRGRYTLTETEQGLSFSIEADDPVALRALMTSITKTLIVYQKMQGLADESGEN